MTGDRIEQIIRMGIMPEAPTTMPSVAECPLGTSLYWDLRRQWVGHEEAVHQVAKDLGVTKGEFDPSQVAGYHRQVKEDR